MQRKTLLRISAGLTLFTFVGHTLNLLLPLPADLKEVVRVHELMAQTFVPMPMGSAKSMATVMTGADTCVSVLLLMAGVIYLLLAQESLTLTNRRLLIVTNLSMLAVSIISFVCFFPLPAICTGLAALLGFSTHQMKS